MIRLTLLLALVASPAFSEEAKKKLPAPPQAAAGEDNEVVARVTCHKEKEERTLEVIPKEKGCVLHYTKGRKTEEVAHAAHGVQICQDTLVKVQKRLEAASFHCE